MPAAAFTIGSFGDIATILRLTWAIRTVLYEAASTAADIRELVADMDSFSRSLLQVKSVLEVRGKQLSPDIRNGIAHALSICETILRAVEIQISSYRRGLVRTHGAAWQRYWNMLAWSVLGGKKAADALKMRLSEQLHVVHTYLALSQSHDQARLMGTAQQQGATLARVHAVVTDISKRFDFGIPSFHFQDPFDGKYYLPMGRTSLHKLAELYEMFTGERTCIVDSPHHQTHRTMLIPIGFRYHPSRYDPPYAMVDCFIFRDPAFGLPQVLMSVPWLVRRRHSPGAHTPFYERIGTERCTNLRSTSGTDSMAHLHFRACEQILYRRDDRFADFWDNHRYKSFALVGSAGNFGQTQSRGPARRPSLLEDVDELDGQFHDIVKVVSEKFFPIPGTTANWEVCLAISPIAKLRHTADCRAVPGALTEHTTALLGGELLRRIDKHSHNFKSKRAVDLLWMCWAEELRKAVFTVSP